jgi:hypothetical protein
MGRPALRDYVAQMNDRDGKIPAKLKTALNRFFGKVECCMDKRHRYKTAVLIGTNIYVGLVSFDHDKGFLVDVLGEVKWMKEEELDRFVL